MEAPLPRRCWRGLYRHYVALAVIVAGFVAPIAAVSLRTSASPPADWITLATSVVRLLASPTFIGEAHTAEAATMTLLEAYMLFGVPLLALALGVVVYLIATRDRERSTPAE